MIDGVKGSYPELATADEKATARYQQLSSDDLLHLHINKVGILTKVQSHVSRLPTGQTCLCFGKSTSKKLFKIFLGGILLCCRKQLTFSCRRCMDDGTGGRAYAYVFRHCGRESLVGSRVCWTEIKYQSKSAAPVEPVILTL